MSPSPPVPAAVLSSLSRPLAARVSRPGRAAGQASVRAAWLLAASLALTACGQGDAKKPADQAAAKPAPEVGVVQLQAENQALTSTLPGRTTAFVTAEIRPQVSGIVQKRLFTEGEVVRAGQPLYQIDPATHNAAVASAQAALNKAQATARTARVTAERNAELVKIDAISRQLNDESQALAAQTQSDVAVAKAALDTARINQRYTRIEAPISGRVSLSTVTPGALVTANQTQALTTIVQMDPMYVDFSQSSAELLALQRDWDSGRFARIDGDSLQVNLALEDGSHYPHPGKLRFSGLIVNPGTGAVTLRAVVPNPESRLLPGMYVRALLPTGIAAGAILVPQQAVSRDIAGTPSVLVVDPQNQVVRRTIAVSQAVGSRWLVESGLEAGERVMVDGFQRAKAGDTVQPKLVNLTQPDRPFARASQPASGQAPAEPPAPPASATAAASPASR